MAELIGTRKLPTSGKGAVGFVKSSAGVAVWAVGIALGLGLFVWALPWIRRIPFLGPMIGAGTSFFPNQGAQQSQGDQYGPG